VEAFRATLEELADADLLVHVVDLGDPDHEQHIEAVSRILGELDLAEKPRLLAGNKIDRLPPADAARLATSVGAIAFSALDQVSLSPLLAAIERELWKEGRTEPGARTGAPADADAARLATSHLAPSR